MCAISLDDESRGRITAFMSETYGDAELPQFATVPPAVGSAIAGVSYYGPVYGNIVESTPMCVRFAGQARRGNSGTLLFHGADRSGAVGVVHGCASTDLVLSPLPSMSDDRAWHEVTPSNWPTLADRCECLGALSWRGNGSG